MLMLFYFYFLLRITRQSNICAVFSASCLWIISREGGRGLVFWGLAYQWHQEHEEGDSKTDRDTTGKRCR